MFDLGEVLVPHSVDLSGHVLQGIPGGRGGGDVFGVELGERKTLLLHRFVQRLLAAGVCDQDNEFEPGFDGGD